MRQIQECNKDSNRPAINIILKTINVILSLTISVFVTSFSDHVNLVVESLYHNIFLEYFCLDFVQMLHFICILDILGGIESGENNQYLT